MALSPERQAKAITEQRLFPELPLGVKSTKKQYNNSSSGGLWPYCWIWNKIIQANSTVYVRVKSYVFISLHPAGHGCCGAEDISLRYHKNLNMFLSMKSRDSPRRVILVEFWRERGARYQPYYVTCIERFGEKGILYWINIMLGSRTVLCLTDSFQSLRL